MSKLYSGAEIIFKCLKDQDVKYIFGYPGGAVLPIYDELKNHSSIKHILGNYQKNHQKVFDLLQEILRDLKNYDLEVRLEELESKFAKDFSENTFNEIRELKKKQNIN